MKRNATPTNIIFGEGVVSIDGKPIGLTKDGAKFTVEYTYRAIEADGDKKKVKGRIVKDSAVAKLEVNHLEVLTDLAKLHPGLNVDTTTKEGYTIIRGTNGIDDENDYHKVSFKGKQKMAVNVKLQLMKLSILKTLNGNLKIKMKLLIKQHLKVLKMKKMMELMKDGLSHIKQRQVNRYEKSKYE
ncbi:hypothetical protein HMPREF0979_00795 [Coprobacillus sp. 8_1_38FAA]|nr:hypothetical protein HMPREF0979_00795 [Coprobacillus sp. 8_1_38FAA]